MSIKIDIFHHFASDCDEKKLDLILEKLILIIKNQTQMAGTLADIQASNAALIVAVQAEDTVIDGAVTAIGNLATQVTTLGTQLAAAIAANDPIAIQAVADSLTATGTDITAKTSALAAAVASVPPATT